MVVAFFHTPGNQTPADVLSKHWMHHAIHKMLQPILFCEGDTINCNVVMKSLQE